MNNQTSEFMSPLDRAYNLKSIVDINTPWLNSLLDSWLNEDIGRGDLTNDALMGQNGSAYWITKQNGIFCGGSLAVQLFKRLNNSVQVNLIVKDGECFTAGQRLLEVEGPTQTLVAVERTALNLAMRLSGIATATAALVKKLEGTKVSLTDTRKTTPGLRVLEKYAFRCGGGKNHRVGLDDAAMLKENHIAWAGGINPALQAIRASSPWPSKIIVEVENPGQAEEAIRAGVDAILLDEFTPELLNGLVPRLRELALRRNSQKASNQIVLEASGVDPMYLEAFAATGVDLISTSAPMTRSSWIDFSMRFKKANEWNK